MKLEKGLNHALALIRAETLHISYEEALKQIKKEDEVVERAAAKAVIDINK